MDILCHIVGITSLNKNNFYKTMEKLNYNVLDLDEYSNNIFNDSNMITMYKQYQGFKDTKNDKFKDIDKKMTMYWETSMDDMINNHLTKDCSNIVIGYCHHFKNITKRLNIKTNNKFIIKVSKKDVRMIISNNITKHKQDIINGAYPLENIDFDYIYTNRQKIDAIYEKNGYITKTVDTIYSIFEMNKNKIEGDGLWIALTVPYNIGSLIHPKKNDKIYGFTDMLMALLSSFNFTDDDLEKYFIKNVIKIRPKKHNVLDRMNEKRYLYLVEKTMFIPHEKGNNIKYFSQVPVKILNVIKIQNVYKEFFDKNVVITE
jgi:hypothetical protein